jgi:hypothetical protein
MTRFPSCFFAPLQAQDKASKDIVGIDGELVRPAAKAQPELTLARSQPFEALRRGRLPRLRRMCSRRGRAVRQSPAETRFSVVTVPPFAVLQHLPQGAAHCR